MASAHATAAALAHRAPQDGAARFGGDELAWTGKRSRPEEGEPPPSRGGGGGSGGFLATYGETLDKRPLLLKCLTCFCSFTVADLAAQALSHRPFDLNRFLRYATFGALVQGVASHWFYGALELLIPGTSAAAIARKVGLDSFVWNPVSSLVFLGYMGIAEGFGVQEVALKIRRHLWAKVTASWAVWPIAHAINFRFVPAYLRSLYASVVQILFACYLAVLEET